jgi:hypothetical protein
MNPKSIRPDGRHGGTTGLAVRESATGREQARDSVTSRVRARDRQTITNIVRRDTDVRIPRRYDMSQMTQDMARDRMRQMRRDMEDARTVHGRYAARQRPRRTA